MKQLGADGNYYWYPGLANGGDDYSNPEPYNGQDGGQVSTPTNSAGDPGTVIGPPNAQGGIGGMAGAASTTEDDLRQYLQPAQFSQYKMSGLSPDAWLAQQSALQSDAKQKADLALQLQQKQLGLSGASLANTQANEAAIRAQQQAQLAQQAYQWGNLSAEQKATLAQQQAQLANTQSNQQAQLAQNAQQFNQNYALDQGKTLLQLGSRPDTLTRYLYAIRGQQTPQAIAGTTTNLPGFQNVVGQPNPGATIPGAGVAGAAPSSAAPAPAPNASTVPMLPGTIGMQTPQPVSLLQNNAANPNYESNLSSIAAQSPALTQLLASAHSGSPTGQLSGGNAPVSLNLAPANPSIQAPAYNPNVTAAQNSAGPKNSINGINLYKDGGVIPEPVTGVGDISGQPYKFGEAGPEAVIPNDELEKMPSDMLERLMQASGKVDIHTDGPDGKKQKMSFILKAPVKGPKPSPSKAVNSYADGGTIGYDPSNVPSLGSQGAGFFNDPNLQTVVNRGYNSSPQTPLFPQVGIATGQGQSLIPSMQRLNSLLPSEKSLYSGALQDEFGAQPDDIYALSQSLAPGARNLTTPNYKV